MGRLVDTEVILKWSQARSNNILDICGLTAKINNLSYPAPRLCKKNIFVIIVYKLCLLIGFLI